MSEVYRKASLERISSPDELDKMVRVTSVFSWLVLAGAGIIVVAVLLWGFFGSVSEDITISGVFMQDARMEKIYAGWDGIVEKYTVTTGSKVERGDTVAVISGKKVVCGYSGVVGEIYGGERLRVNADSELMEIRKPIVAQSDRIVLSYIPLSTAVLLEEGMKAMLVPSSFSEEKYGHMSGFVKQVGEYGVSEDNMYRRLGDSLLVQAFRSMENAEPVVEVVIALDEKEDSVNGYAWSNLSGESLVLPELLMMNVRIVKSEQAPMKLLLD